MIGALDNEPGASLRGRYSAYIPVRYAWEAPLSGSIAHLDNEPFWRLAMSYNSYADHPIGSDRVYRAIQYQLTDIARHEPRTIILESCIRP